MESQVLIRFGLEKTQIDLFIAARDLKNHRYKFVYILKT